jgi:hypothetical protein
VPIELCVKKINNALVPVEQVDLEVLQDVKNGQGFRVEIVKVSDRSLKHHRLYWGGLVRLVADYWEPESGLISKYDKKVMGGLIDWVAAQGKNTDALSDLINLYLQDRAQRIKAALPDYEKAGALLQDIHEWLKEEAGYYDAVITPTGVRKKLHSINFNAMPSEEEFMVFYRKVFGVAWRYVFSKANFESEEQALNLALEMSQMGR